MTRPATSGNWPARSVLYVAVLTFAIGALLSWIVRTAIG